MDKKVWIYIGAAFILGAIIQLIIAGPSAGSHYESPEDHAVWSGLKADNELLTLSQDDSYDIWIARTGTIDFFTIKNSTGQSVLEGTYFEDNSEEWIYYGEYYAEDCPCTINLNSTSMVLFTPWREAGMMGDEDVYFMQMMYASMTCCLGIVILVGANSIKQVSDTAAVELQQQNDPF